MASKFHVELADSGKILSPNPPDEHWAIDSARTYARVLEMPVLVVETRELADGSWQEYVVYRAVPSRELVLRETHGEEPRT